MKEIENLKKALWKERWSFVGLIIFVYSFLLGAAIEHYSPKIISFIW